MQIGVVTLFPEMLKALNVGITGRALKQGILALHAFNPRDYAEDIHRTVDDRPYGGGPGMVMQVEPLQKAILAAKASLVPNAKVIYLSPQGRRLQQKDLHVFASRESLILVAGRYEGVDERLIELAIDEEVSVGDYILTGGELPAMVIIDGITRLLPGALGDEASAEQDSFGAGGLDCPHYTRPELVQGLRVPNVLLSGDHEAIRRWRLKQSLGKTWLKRPDILASLLLNEEQQMLLNEFISEYKVQGE